MSESTIEYIAQLVSNFSALQPFLDEHRADSFGEVLPHVFLGDVTRFVVREFVRGTNSLVVQPMLDELELAFSQGGQEIAELIAVSFLANVPRRGQQGDAIRGLLGPRLKAELERIG